MKGSWLPAVPYKIKKLRKGKLEAKYLHSRVNCLGHLKNYTEAHQPQQFTTRCENITLKTISILTYQCVLSYTGRRRGSATHLLKEGVRKINMSRIFFMGKPNINPTKLAHSLGGRWTEVGGRKGGERRRRERDGHLQKFLHFQKGE